jgi:hypothetical protein
MFNEKDFILSALPIAGSFIILLTLIASLFSFNHTVLISTNSIGELYFELILISIIIMGNIYISFKILNNVKSNITEKTHKYML